MNLKKIFPLAARETFNVLHRKTNSRKFDLMSFEMSAPLGKGEERKVRLI